MLPCASGSISDVPEHLFLILPNPLPGDIQPRREVLQSNPPSAEAPSASCDDDEYVADGMGKNLKECWREVTLADVPFHTPDCSGSVGISRGWCCRLWIGGQTSQGDLLPL